MLIAVCILTPFAISWRSMMDPNIATTTIRPNVSFSQTYINEVMNLNLMYKDSN
jgi:hypothetical protein